MMQATVIKTSTDDYIVNIDENESDIPATPFQCWIVGIDEMNALYNSRAIRAEARAAELEAHVAQLTAERDAARYEATMEVSRIAYDMAQQERDAGSMTSYSAMNAVFNRIVTSKAANP